jgi:hypothetical protein
MRVAASKLEGLPRSEHRRFAELMKILARRIAKELKYNKRIKRQLRLEAGEYGHCAIYEDQLQRVWPISEANRKAKIEQFAKENGFRLVYYKAGLCAIFEEQRPLESSRTSNPA